MRDNILHNTDSLNSIREGHDTFARLNLTKQTTETFAHAERSQRTQEAKRQLQEKELLMQDWRIDQKITNGS